MFYNKFLLGTQLNNNYFDYNDKDHYIEYMSEKYKKVIAFIIV
jgi:hypothetical protein